MMKWLSMLVIASTLLLTGCGAGTLYSADFNGSTDIPADLTLTNLYGGVVADADALRLIATDAVRGQTGELRFPLDATLTDYALSARIRIHSGQVRFWVRADERGCNGYALVIDPVLDSYRLSIAENCVLRTLESSSLLDVNNDEWLDVRVEIHGSRIQAFINSAPFYDVEDTVYTGGLPLLQLVNDNAVTAQAEIDHVQVNR